MTETVGIRFPNSGKTYCFKSEGVEARRGDRVVVESELGISIGLVVKLDCVTDAPPDQMRSVLRKVTQIDLQQEQENEEVKREAREFGMQRIEERKLPMKLMDTEVTLDRKRFIFYFVADGRIDFRELVKDLASKFRTRIELRQIGVRDAAKIVGGYGICGQEFCCKTFLKSFAPISIKMAKQQDLVLNTCKLSGQCGRLMCCLNYEYDPNESGRKRRVQHLVEMEPQDSAEELEAIEDRESPIVVARVASEDELEPWDRPEVVEQNRQIAEAAAASIAKPQERAHQQQHQEQRQPSSDQQPQDGARRGRRRKKRGGGARPPAQEGARPQGAEGARPQGAQPHSAQPQQRADAGAQREGAGAQREGTGAPREGAGTPDAKKKSRRRRWKNKKKEGGGAPAQGAPSQQ